MRVGIIQSAYVPWRGYFDFISDVDHFVIFDEVQYPRGRSWRNRNRLKIRTGVSWLTVPVHREGLQAIDEVTIAEDLKPWRVDHEARIADSLGKAPFFKDAIDLWRSGVDEGSGRLSALNVRLIRLICEYLGIRTPIHNSRDFPGTTRRTDRLIELVTKLNGTCYVSGPSARSYLDESSFRRNRLRLEYKSYVYDPYPQLWGDFVNEVSILDLIANSGKAAAQQIRSRAPNEVAVP